MTGVEPSNLITANEKEREIFVRLTMQSDRLTDDLEVHAAVERNRQRQVREGVEAHARVTTLLARDLRLELSVKEVNDDGLVALQVVFPSLTNKKK